MHCVVPDLIPLAPCALPRQPPHSLEEIGTGLFSGAVCLRELAPLAPVWSLLQNHSSCHPGEGSRPGNVRQESGMFLFSLANYADGSSFRHTAERKPSSASRVPHTALFAKFSKSNSMSTPTFGPSSDYSCPSMSRRHMAAK
jgi:hypothetical protein